jgi:hypothetical protein
LIKKKKHDDLIKKHLGNNTPEWVIEKIENIIIEILHDVDICDKYNSKEILNFPEL